MKVIMMYPRYHDHKNENLQKEQNISISSPGFVKLRIRFNSTQSLRASLQLIRNVCVPNTRGLSRACMLCTMHVYIRQR